MHLIVLMFIAFRGFGIEEDRPVYLAVDKQGLVAQLRTWPEPGKDSVVLKSFTVAIGKQSGDKTKQGDNRTPEGVYFVQGLIRDDELPEKYGPFAVPIDYPNPMDAKAAKTGYGIWLHGVIDDQRIQEANVTEGCVAFYNADIRELAGILSPFQSVVAISQNSNELNLDRDLLDLKSRARAWAEAWANRDLEKYMSFYAPDFEHSYGSFAQFREHKKAVFAKYRRMEVKMTEPLAISHPKYALTVMNQTFRGDDHYKADGRKLLYWDRTPLGWKIAREKFSSQAFHSIRLSGVPLLRDLWEKAMLARSATR